MTARAESTSAVSSPYATDAARWRAVVARDCRADGAFVFSVRTTGVYCRPGCPARRALRKNVRFHATCRDAEAAGFRACRRCRPKDATLAARQGAIVAAACEQIASSTTMPTLPELARSAGLSPFHFHRLFRAATGTTPKRYALARRAENQRNSRRRAPAALHYAVGECWLGKVLVAASERGIRAILLGDDETALLEELATRFPIAERSPGDPTFQRTVRRVVAFLEAPSAEFALPLDLQGTVFECRVWEALRNIPPGKTVTYTQLAERLGAPRSARAVAKACAANPIAVAVPCHRVIRRDGSLAGYRWGMVRKEQLLNREGRRD